LREERKQELEEHVEAVNALLADADGEREEGEDVWNGSEEEQVVVEPVDHEEEYIDEDRYTTVTVEAVDVSKEGLVKIGEEDSSDETAEADPKPVAAETSKKKLWPKKERKKKFRYESKAERKFTRGKQRAGNKAKADARRGND
jgi:ribosomal RNA-processing protein 17